ncbi:MAG: hypothetical protein RL172_504 [Bacteroidota bacterium]|jgi:hypothetical protein
MFDILFEFMVSKYGLIPRFGRQATNYIDYDKKSGNCCYCIFFIVLVTITFLPVY